MIEKCPKKEDLVVIFSGKRSIFSLSCVNCASVLREPEEFFFKEIRDSLRTGDVIFAFGDNGTHAYTIRKDADGEIYPSSLVAFQDFDHLPRRRFQK